MKKDRGKTRKEKAKAYAKRVIERDFGQQIDDDTLNSVADKILRAMPQDQNEEQCA